MPQTLTLVFMLGLGILFFVLAFVQKSKAKKAAETWPKTDGIVENSELSVSHSHDSDGSSSTTYSAHVNYSYKVNGMSYKNDAIGFGRSSGGKKKAEKKLAQYPQGTPVTVYYDPKDPTKAVIEPVASTFGMYLFVGIMLFVLGIVIFLVM